MSDFERPKFKPVKAVVNYANPEELFYKLSGRDKSHGYLRGPQQDVLREYSEKATAMAPDIAFELPTGTGKTAVGLLIAEWKRLSGKRVAYLSLTNQLAGQVLDEAKRLGLSCADLRGDKMTRSAAEEGRYRTRSAVAVTTYSNLFNINPVLQESDVIVFDDAHGGEQYVSAPWTVSVTKADEKGLYNSLLGALKPGLSEAQIWSIQTKGSLIKTHLADPLARKECFDAVAEVLELEKGDVRYAWAKIKERLHSCLFLVSGYEIVIRPLVPPTHTHKPFAAAGQRLYMSATLGGESDLQRSYGIRKLKMIRSKSPQWGRRYVFVPGIYTAPANANWIAARVWDQLKVRRAVLLSPSDRILNQTYSNLESEMKEKPTRVGALDITDSVASFINNQNVVLALAGRYDGLDLPDDQCRLLILSESPAAVNLLERHLSEAWKMGPVLKKRERTRLMQGMGRCTRNATDFAVILWLGQSLVDEATSPILVGAMPTELSAEITWGVQQSELAAKKPNQLVGMILSLISDAEYRREADQAIEEIEGEKVEILPKDYDEAGEDEVRYGVAMWDGNYSHALELGRGIADQLVSPELAGYRAWWWYLSSVAASLAEEKTVELDCLRRGCSCGVNSGWMNQVLRRRTKDAETVPVDGIEENAEGLWNVLTTWGWAGPSFEQRLGEMAAHLSTLDHVQFHEGLEYLGKCYGAETTRKTEQGAPDVVWSFPNDVHVAFEAKTEKKGTALSKKDLLEAKGHVDWVHARLADDPKSADVAVVVVAEVPDIHEIGVPFAGDLFYATPVYVEKLAARATEAVRRLRLKFTGREFAESAREFSAALVTLKLDIPSLRRDLLTERLKGK